VSGDIQKLRELIISVATDLLVVELVEKIIVDFDFAGMSDKHMLLLLYNQLLKVDSVSIYFLIHQTSTYFYNPRVLDVLTDLTDTVNLIAMDFQR